MKASVEIIGGAMDGIVFAIQSTASIGRDSHCQISIPVDRYVSKTHAKLSPAAKGFTLEDLGSTNGSFVDEEPVNKPVPLPDGQIFRIGRTLLRISYG